MTVKTDCSLDDFMKSLEVNCPFTVEIRKPCKKETPTYTFNGTGLRGRVGLLVLRLAYWLGKVELK